MLTREDNELLTRVGPGTPLGQLMRHYWIPVVQSSELEPGGTETGEAAGGGAGRGAEPGGARGITGGILSASPGVPLFWTQRRRRAALCVSWLAVCAKNAQAAPLLAAGGNEGLW